MPFSVGDHIYDRMMPLKSGPIIEVRSSVYVVKSEDWPSAQIAFRDALPLKRGFNPLDPLGLLDAAKRDFDRVAGALRAPKPGETITPEEELRLPPGSITRTSVFGKTTYEGQL